MTKIDTHGLTRVGPLFLVKNRLTAILQNPRSIPPDVYVVETFNRDGSISKRQNRDLYDMSWYSLERAVLRIISEGGTVYEG